MKSLSSREKTIRVVEPESSPVTSPFGPIQNDRQASQLNRGGWWRFYYYFPGKGSGAEFIPH